MRKFVTLIVFILMIILVRVSVFAKENNSETMQLNDQDSDQVTDSGELGDNLKWEFSEGTLTISGLGDMKSQESYPWTKYDNQITSLILEPGVTSVSTNAFFFCENISEISFPEGLTRIGLYSFRRLLEIKSFCQRA